MCKCGQRLCMAWTAFLAALTSLLGQHTCTIAHAFGSIKSKPEVAIGILSLNNFAIKDKVCAGCATSLKDDHLRLGKVDCELTLLTKA